MNTLSDSVQSSEVQSTVEPAINLVGVTRRFGRKTVVDDLTLQVPPGSFMGLIGLNGAGKSTTLRMAVGLLAPTVGTIRLAGCDIRNQPVEMKRRVGYVPDRPNIYGWMRVEEAIGFVRHFHTTWNVARCIDLVKRFRLPMETKVKHLSKGQAAKLQLLVAVCHDPQVLILDEPTSGFDPIVREEFFEGILDFAADQGQTILFSSHALADVQRLADRVALMHEGKLLLSGTVDEILGRIKRLRVILSDEAVTPPDFGDMLRRRQYGREWLVTIDHFDAEVAVGFRAQPGIDRMDVVDLSLDDIFKDTIRGREEAVSC